MNPVEFVLLFALIFWILAIILAIIEHEVFNNGNHD